MISPFHAGIFSSGPVLLRLQTRDLTSGATAFTPAPPLRAATGQAATISRSKPVPRVTCSVRARLTRCC